MATMTGRRPDMPPLAKSLSARLLVLTVFFVMLSEVLIYAPSAGRFRLTYLEQRLAPGTPPTLPHPGAVDRHLADHRRARLSQPAMVDGAADAPPDWKHDAVPRAPGGR